MMKFDIFLNVHNRSEIVPAASKHRHKISGGLREGFMIDFGCFEKKTKNDEKSDEKSSSFGLFAPREECFAPSLRHG